ncbi:unnamed protein product [Amoebophrya sp. A120]|nr:unnamed protein product [Amoebophrya sp. A120]|eukprot:GSA120T00026192001.1
MMQQQQQQLLLQQQYAAALVVSQQYAAARAAHAAAAMAAAATGPSYYDPATDDPMMYHHHAAATHGYGSYDHPTAVGVGGPSYDGAGYDDSPQHDALVHHPLGGGGPAYENIKVPKAVTFGDLPPSSLDGEGKAGGAAVSGGRGGSSSASRNRGKNNNLISRLPPGLEVVFEESESCSGRSSSSAATTSGSPADRGAATNALPSPTHNIIPDEQHQSALQGNVTSSPPTTNMRLPPELPSCLTQLKNRQR